jgi:hypothetical protein
VLRQGKGAVRSGAAQIAKAVAGEMHGFRATQGRVTRSFRDARAITDAGLASGLTMFGWLLLHAVTGHGAVAAAFLDSR